MHYLWTTITVRDMEESLAFYQNALSLPIVNRMQNLVSEIVFLGEGETKLELIHHPGEAPKPIGGSISIGFEVENLDDTMELLKKQGIKIEEGPFSPNPSIRFCFALDPNGLRIQFVERH